MIDLCTIVYRILYRNNVVQALIDFYCVTFVSVCSEIKLSELQRPTCVPDILFDLLCDPIDKKVSVRKFWAVSISYIAELLY